MFVSDFFFFFQAEDGIRDDLVTGVQTCALPISRLFGGALRHKPPRRPSNRFCRPARRDGRTAAATDRSEERRVGKECRSRWGPQQYKKKKKKQERVSGPDAQQSR